MTELLSRDRALWTAASAAGCPAAKIGRELRQLADALSAADDAYLAAPPARARAAERRLFACCARTCALRSKLSRVQATSLEGAMAQAMAASSILDANSDTLAPETEGELQALLVSIVRLAEASSSMPREEMAGDFLMPRNLDLEKEI
jgi:hypothetical protein